MRPETTEWIKKAEADFASMVREMNAAKDLNYDLVCFGTAIGREISQGATLRKHGPVSKNP